MKINENFVLRQVAGTWVSMPINTNIVNFNGMLELNEAGAFLWHAIEHGNDTEDALVDTFCTEYDVSKEQARTDVVSFCRKLAEIGCLEF